MSTIFYINPTKVLLADNIKNTMVLITNYISNFANNVNIIIEENYNKLKLQILTVVSNYLKIYKFAKANIFNINIEIYNSFFDVVLYIYFNIYESYFTIETSFWKNFYNNSLLKQTVVYDNLSLIEKNNLRFSIVNDSLYLSDNIVFTYNTKITEGILIKIKQNHNCVSNENMIYINTIYWY